MKEETKLSKVDISDVKWLKRKIAKGYKFFIARKSGGNASGIGANRSVILGKAPEDPTWYQALKVWGNNNEERAKEIMRLATTPSH